MAAHFPILVKCFAGLEAVLAAEMKQLDIASVEEGKRAVHCQGDIRTVYQLNLHCRTALRVLIPIYGFEAEDEQDLYKGVRAIDWTDYLEPRSTLAVDSVVHSSVFRHSHYVALKVKDAIVDQFRDTVGKRPSVDVRRPDLRVHVHVRGTEVRILLDSSGDSLHKRGYRKRKSGAPINEALAAGMVLLSGWKGDTPFVDGMCGAGTILLEAALLAANRAPGLDRSFGFERWQDFDRKLWRELLSDAKAAIQTPQADLVGMDRDGTSLLSAQDNLRRAGLYDQVRLEQTDFFQSDAPTKPGTLILNPPYGERMKEIDIEALYSQIGDQWKQAYPGFEAWMISSNLPAMKRVGLRPYRKHILFNGPLECRYYGYQLYRGTKTEEAVPPTEG
ncbi:MAG: THUMP domain-containing protein [Bacteroidota bacterium]